MNKVTKYITTGAAAMLMLMSVGAVQPSANAARHYRTRVSRYAKKNVRHGNKRRVNNKRQYHKQRKVRKNRKAKVQKLGKKNNKTVKNTVKRYRHKANKRNKRYVRRNFNRLTRRHGRRTTKRVLKARYRVVPEKLSKRATKRWNRALRKSGFVDGYAMSIASAAHGISIPENEANYIFSKYAPNDRRAIIPAYMNPKMEKINRVVPIKGYRDVNNDIWFQGYFGLKSTKHNTKHPKAYMYQPKLHGWVLLKR